MKNIMMTLWVTLGLSMAIPVALFSLIAGGMMNADMFTVCLLGGLAYMFLGIAKTFFWSPPSRIKTI